MDPARGRRSAGARIVLGVLGLLGDTVHPDGAVERLDATVFAPLRPVLRRGTELLAVLGNHDAARGTGEDLIRRLGRDRRYWAWRRGDVLVVGIDSTRVDDRQLRWLDRILAAADERWRIVALHHPPYSAGYHGPIESLRDTVVPLLERHGVQLALSGHSHDYQRSRELGGVTYVVSGGGSKTERTGTDPDIEVSHSWHHFVDLAVHRDRIVVRAVGADGRVFDEATIGP